MLLKVQQHQSAVEERADEIARVMTAEHGKTLTESRMEVDASADTFDYHAGSARNPVGTRCVPAAAP